MASSQEYARALALALDHTDPVQAEGVLTRFVALVQARGHKRLLPKIVTAFERDMDARKRMNETNVTVADAGVIKAGADEIAEHARAIGVPPEALLFVVDDTLITGYRMRTRDAIIDASGKRALLELYRTMVAA